MPIVIKELFPSDPISEALEKINFNFDQMILSGGGPPGPIGPQGPQGIPGSQGERGDHWQAGSSAPTTDHGPNFGPLKDYDFWLDNSGSVFYWDSIGATWSPSGVNLKGPTGTAGVAGGSYEVRIYPGLTGNAIVPSGGQNYIPTITGATTIPSGGTDFVIPTDMDKNALFLGSTSWAYNKLTNFGNYDIVGGIPGAPPNVSSQRLIPKQTIIQSGIDYTGLGGLTIGAYGATSGSGTFLPDFTGSNSITSALDFFTAGFAITSNSPYSHFFKMRTGTVDLMIQAGDLQYPYLADGKSPNLILKGTKTIIGDLNPGSLDRAIFDNGSTLFRDPAYFGRSSMTVPGSTDSGMTLDNTGVGRNRGNFYVGDFSGTSSLIGLGYGRTVAGNASLDFYTNFPTTPTFQITRSTGANGIATINQTGSGALEILSYGSSSTINIGANNTNGAIRFISNTGGEAARIDTANLRVGIRNSNPLRVLDIVAIDSIGLRSSSISYGSPNSFEILNNTSSPVSSRLAFGADGTGWKLAFAKNISGTYTDLMTLEESGNLGIGTTTPGAKLEVSGNVLISNSSTGNAFRVSGPLGNSSIWTTSLFGATQPKYSLESNHATTGGYNHLLVMRGTNITLDPFTRRQGIVFKMSNEQDLAESEKMGAVYLESTEAYANNPALCFATKNLERLRIASTGNIGIGTTSPERRLHIEHNSTNSELLIRSTNAINTNPNQILFQRRVGAGNTMASGTVLGGLSFGGWDGTSAYTIGSNGGAEILALTAVSWTAGNKKSQLQFKVSGASFPNPATVLDLLSDSASFFSGVITLGNTLLESFVPINTDDGSLTNPSYSFISNDRTGMHYAISGTNESIVFGINGNQILQMNRNISTSDRISTFTGDLRVLDNLLIAPGSLASPAIQFAADSDTGISSGGTNAISIVAGGAERMNISSTGIKMVNSTFTLHKTWTVSTTASPAGSSADNYTLNPATYDRILYISPTVEYSGSELYANSSGYIRFIASHSGNSVFYAILKRSAGTPGPIDTGNKYGMDINTTIILPAGQTGQFDFEYVGGVRSSTGGGGGPIIFTLKSQKLGL